MATVGGKSLSDLGQGSVWPDSGIPTWTGAKEQVPHRRKAFAAVSGFGFAMASRPTPAQSRFFLIGTLAWFIVAAVGTLQFLGFVWRGSELVAISLGLVYWVVGGYLTVLRRQETIRTETGANIK